MNQKLSKATQAAVTDFATRMRSALRTFRASDDPMWKRTQEGLDWFDGLPMRHLPPRLVDDLQRRFGAINEIVAQHSVDKRKDYRRVPPQDLALIQDIIESCLLDPPGHDWPSRGA